MAETVVACFDRAAGGYDEAAQLQHIVARKLVTLTQNAAPASILDIGCGTGAVAALAASLWPQATITGLDASAAMLAEAQRKVPRLEIVQSDAAAPQVGRKFDLIFSSMLLHWLPQPREVLQGWAALLNPGGVLHVALPVAGSLSEWRNLCRVHSIEDGLWDFPSPTFAQGLAAASRLERENMTYDNLRAFLDSLKQTGAHKSRLGHAPASAAQLRRLLQTQRGPFATGYDILYLSLPVP